MSWFLKEQPDDHYEPSRGVTHVFQAAWQTLAEDANFRRLAIVSALFSTTLVLFPHYQAIARERAGAGHDVARVVGRGPERRHGALQPAHRPDRRRLRQPPGAANRHAADRRRPAGRAGGHLLAARLARLRSRSCSSSSA